MVQTVKKRIIKSFVPARLRIHTTLNPSEMEAVFMRLKGWRQPSRVFSFPIPVSLNKIRKVKNYGSTIMLWEYFNIVVGSSTPYEAWEREAPTSYWCDCFDAIFVGKIWQTWKNEKT